MNEVTQQPKPSTPVILIAAVILVTFTAYMATSIAIEANKRIANSVKNQDADLARTDRDLGSNVLHEEAPQPLKIVSALANEGANQTSFSAH